jgi:class 3 adenylate cyclase
VNGPEHYRRAEELLDLNRPGSDAGVAARLQAAAVHAQLAAVALAYDAVPDQVLHEAEWANVTQ